MKHIIPIAMLLAFSPVQAQTQELLRDGGFEGLSSSGCSLSSGVNGAWTWTQSPAYCDPIGIRTLTAPKGAHTGTYDVFFNSNTPSSSSLYQTLNIPSGGPVTLSFWTKIATNESRTAVGAYDTLTTSISDQASSVAPFVTVLSNKDATQFYTQFDYDVWVKHTYDISNFRGKTVRLQFDSVEDAGSNRTTTFSLDDVSIIASGSGSDGCTEDANTLCLVGSRYKVTSHWLNQYAGGAAANLSKARLTDRTGAFWIADASTYEYMIRFNTATDNGKAWIAIPTFTDVEFWITVTDTVNGQSKEYHSAPGNKTLIYDPNTFSYP